MTSSTPRACFVPPWLPADAACRCLCGVRAPALVSLWLVRAAGRHPADAGAVRPGVGGPPLVLGSAAAPSAVLQRSSLGEAAAGNTGPKCVHEPASSPALCPRAVCSVSAPAEHVAPRPTSLLRPRVLSLCVVPHPHAVKTALLSAVQTDKSGMVVRRICHAIAELCAVVLEKPGWPELMPCIFALVKGGDSSKRASALFLFNKVAEYCGDVRAAATVVDWVRVACVASVDGHGASHCVLCWHHRSSVRTPSRASHG